MGSRKVPGDVGLRRDPACGPAAPQ